jgi:hypothetical protein
MEDYLQLRRVIGSCINLSFDLASVCGPVVIIEQAALAVLDR